MRYRREIDGLRAVAVLPVLLFHTGVRWFKGGFIGVDVFFVVSGYLITSIILAQLQNNSFSLARFYESRARRILPALFFLLLFTIPCAYFSLLPDDLENFGQSLFATVLFSNNILLYLTSGYWSLESEFKPLLHTWSLGVEEQYYLAAPIMLFVLFRAKKLKTVTFFSAVWTVSIVFCVLVGSKNQELNFYLIPSRIWEIATGAIVALLPPQVASMRPLKVKNLLSGTGLIMILASIATFENSFIQPSALTLIPTLGAAAILTYCDETTFVGKILSRPLLVGIGLISYSAYLWHQPLFAFARILSIEAPNNFTMLFLILLSLALAYLSWKFVEQPFRNSHIVSRRLFWAMAATFGILISGIGFYFHFAAGFSANWPELADADGNNSTQNISFNMSVRRFERLPFVQDTSKENLLVLGNSFARDFINCGLMNGYFSHHNISYISTFDVWSDSLVGLTGIDKELVRTSNYIVFGSEFETRPGGVMALIKSLKHLTNARFVVLGSKNFGSNNNAVMFLPKNERYEYKAKITDVVLAANAVAKQLYPADLFVDQIEMLSDGQGRIPVFTPEMKFISQDRRHLTKAGAKYVGSIIFAHPLLQQLK